MSFVSLVLHIFYLAVGRDPSAVFVHVQPGFFQSSTLELIVVVEVLAQMIQRDLTGYGSVSGMLQLDLDALFQLSLDLCHTNSVLLG